MKILRYGTKSLCILNPSFGGMHNAMQGNLYMGRKTHPSGGFYVIPKKL